MPAAALRRSVGCRHRAKPLLSFSLSRWLQGKNPKYLWHILDTTYDTCVGNCECMPGRDMPTRMHTIHYSCIQKVQKPCKYETEHEFMSTIHTYALSCTRYYYLLWYEKFVKAAGRLPAPYWVGPPVPVFDHAHDEVVLHNRLKAGM